MIPRIIFMGTPEFAVPYLKGLIEAELTPIAVVSQPDRPVGRKQIVSPTPVKEVAIQHDIPVLQPEDIRSPEWRENIVTFKPDLIVVVAYGQIIPRPILDIPPKGCVNIHPSLLPKYRGAAPLQEVILHGEKETGVSIMLMDEKMDHGPILAQEKLTLTHDETYDTLREKTTDVGVPLLIKTLREWLDGKITPQEQDHKKATFTRLLTRENGKIDWSLTALEIERQVRALNPWPGTWTEIHKKRLKILKAWIISSSDMTITDTTLGELVPVIQPGTKSFEKLFVPCGDGYLEILELQPEDRSVMNAKDFINGNYLKQYRIERHSL